jgi:hypothetical protein
MALASDWADDVKREDWSHAFKFYSCVITEYSRKTLTYPEDVLNAFTGILSSLEDYSGWRFYQGLPAQLFDWALLWVPTNSALRRHAVAQGGERFSSWSWMGWDGGISFILAYEDELVDLDSSVDRYLVYSEYADTGIQNIERQVLMMAYSEGETQIRTATWTTPTSGATNQFKILRCWADASRFTEIDIQARTSIGLERGEEIHTCLLLSQGISCGLLLGIDHAELSRYDRTELKLIALSRSKARHGLIRDASVKNAPRWGCVNVMLIHNDGKRLVTYTRVAIGIITKAAWRVLGPVEEQIELR